MNFWWVNHKQTYRAELEGGFIWSPKTSSNGSRNQSYDNLTKVSIGDIIFSYAYAEIKAVGAVIEACKESTKPSEFGKAGEAWEEVGWYVKVKWVRLDYPFIPKNHITTIAPLLPEKYSPISKEGNGQQNSYLAAIDSVLADHLLKLTGEGQKMPKEVADLLDDVEEATIVATNIISDTEKEQLVKSRRGQGIFRDNLKRLEKCCRVTGVSDERLLVASHIKPWRDASNEERLDGSNGLFLSPHVDRLFDRGLISFSEGGYILIADESVTEVLIQW